MARYTKGGDVVRVPQINAELEKIEQAFENVLSRDGDAPNQMNAPIDMNGNKIVNVQTDITDPNSLVQRSDLYVKSEVDAKDAQAVSDANAFAVNQDNAVLAAAQAYAEELAGEPVNTVRYVQEELPVGPIISGARWYKPSEGVTYVYYVDGDSAQWVQETVNSFEGTLRTELAATDSDVLVGGVKAGSLASRSVDIRDFGATCDGITDDSAAIQAAIDFAKAEGGLMVTSPAGKTCFIAASVDFKGLKYIDFLSHIRCDPSIVDVPVTIGGFANNGDGIIRFNMVTDGTSTISAPTPSRPILRVSGVKSSRVQIGACNYIQIFSDDGDVGTGSNAYTEYFLSGATRRLELADVGTFSWITENRFYGGRLKELIISGFSYPHNHNKFFDNTFEGSDVEIRFENADENTIEGARFESSQSSAGISFDADCYNNLIIGSWSGVGGAFGAYSVIPPVVDNGRNNIVTTESILASEKTTLWSVTSNSGVISTGSESDSLDTNVSSLAYAPFGVANIKPSLCVMESPALRVVGISEIVPVEKGDVFSFSVDSEDATWRKYVYIYDSQMRPITNENGGGAYIAGNSIALAVLQGRGLYGSTSNVTPESIGRPMSVAREEVAFVQLALVSYAQSKFKSASAFIYSQKLGKDAIQGSGQKFSTPVLNGNVTQGYVPVGSTYYNAATSLIERNAFQHNSFLTSALSAGATSVTVDTISSVANGDVVGILLDDGTTHWSSVSGLSGSTFVVDAIPAGRSAPQSGMVVFNRWV